MKQIGDKVLFSNSDEKLKSNIGIIIETKGNDYVILNRSHNTNTVYVKSKEYIDDLSNVEKVRQDIIDYFNSKIVELKSKIKTVTSEEKIQERIDKYNDVKQRILKNCERIVVCTDDDEFENRLKEIGKLKKELYTINLDCSDIIRKENGRIKYEIRKVENEMNISLNNISDEKIAKAFKF